MIRHLTSSDYAVIGWSGGKTTQLAIWPAAADYANRDFLWRLSSATVELDESDFTPLPDYDRFIAPLRGDMVLSHDGGASFRLDPYQAHFFDGGVHTHSKGRCVDFNLMLRKGKCLGSMDALRAGGPARLTCGAELAGAERFPNRVLLFYCVEGEGIVSCAGEQVRLCAGETAWIEQPCAAAEILCEAAAGFMTARVAW